MAKPDKAPRRTFAQFLFAAIALLVIVTMILGAFTR
jgi:hypothetical protein